MTSVQAEKHQGQPPGFFKPRVWPFFCEEMLVDD